MGSKENRNRPHEDSSRSPSSDVNNAEIPLEFSPVTYKRIDRQYKKRQEEEELGPLDDDMKEVLGMHDANLRAMATKQIRILLNEGDDVFEDGEASGGNADGDEQNSDLDSDTDSNLLGGVSVKDALSNPIHNASDELRPTYPPQGIITMEVKYCSRQNKAPTGETDSDDLDERQNATAKNSTLRASSTSLDLRVLAKRDIASDEFTPVAARHIRRLHVQSNGDAIQVDPTDGPRPHASMLFHRLATQKSREVQQDEDQASVYPAWSSNDSLALSEVAVSFIALQAVRDA
ncbi:hypothetical protein FISHEDRAFT_56254 [Fistulina hepatica ATCC 64428]|uniref:Uncharacterized protein n=1 Tax=Fistulina hepatica ATCC 64428 TaxID=1128425 RepID=A0A0D7AMK5_9AGAR|nr:hypothetical protein FISHEDRAFT_56254 [Fistulina hepatica ATCC 64428]